MGSIQSIFITKQHKMGCNLMDERVERREVFSLIWKDLKHLLGYRVPAISDEIKLIRPPGALDQLSFLSTCHRCGKCAQACPKKAIKIAGPDKGPSLGTPYLEPGKEPCTFCLECIGVCSSGALRKKVLAQEYVIGKARIDNNYCLARNGQLCGTCKNACPVDISAIKMNSYLDPVIDVAKCNGCGLCVDVCLAPIPAITIEPL